MISSNRTYFTYLTALMVMVALLIGFGLVMIYSTSTLKASQLYHDPYFFLKKQAFAVLIGFALFMIIQALPFRWIERANLPVFFLSIVGLTMILVPGLYVKVGGAERWLTVLGYRIQPAEIIKLSYILFLAKFVSRKQFDPTRFKTSILPIGVSYLVICALLMLQKDFGTIIILALITAIMLFLANLPWIYLGLLSITGSIGLGLLILIEPYRVQRLMSFLDPWSQFENGGFQIIQSFLAFQNGGIFGAGLGSSKQKLFFLPEAHTDFILSVVGEELGLMGVSLILAVFAFMTYIGFKISQKQITATKKFIGYGLTSLLAIQASLNIGVTMGLLPTKGLPLPFVSSGMSSLLTFFVIVALLGRLAKEIPELRHA